MCAVGERNGEGDAVESDLGCLDACHPVSYPGFFLLHVKPIALTGQLLASPEGQRAAGRIQLSLLLRLFSYVPYRPIELAGPCTH
jgi:hypothetical protein